MKRMEEAWQPYLTECGEDLSLELAVGGVDVLSKICDRTSIHDRLCKLRTVFTDIT